MFNREPTRDPVQGMFTKKEYDELHSLIFVDGYRGYTPAVKEVPNGDGNVDADKRYAHVATKYFDTPEQERLLTPYLRAAHDIAVDIGRNLRLPPEFMPNFHTSALRVLEYPVGAIGNEHCDFDLFTLMLYRDQPDCFISKHMGNSVLREVQQFNLQAHMGELGTEIGLGAATPHWVVPSDTVQHSIVYFAIPDWNTRLPRGVLVKDWLNERMARSRTEFKKYE
jgi:hypothetical protein